MFDKFLKYVRAIPKRKHYLEFLTATLSIPVLATAILINIGNLKGEDAKKEPAPERIIVSYPPSEKDQPEDKDEKQTNIEVCIKKVGPVTIRYPQEGDIVTDNPLTVRIDYDLGDYCAVVWSYRINNGRWSDYDDTSFSLYNLPNGQKTLEVRVKSIASTDEKMLKRTFDYQGTEAQPTLVPTEAAVTPPGQ